LPRPTQIVLEPRKSPVQARSAASVEAILQATIQVLLSVGKDRLTTTRVAARAGVSVGTLYQYFPNKSALLQAALKEHLDQVSVAVERVCREQAGNPLRQMATALINTFLEAKMKDPKSSVALYQVSSDLDAARIARQKNATINKAILTMLESTCDPLSRDPPLVAFMLQSAMVGASRSLLESPNPEKRVPALRQELVFFACSYLEACTAQNPIQPAHPATVSLSS
jgi:AcrR family transcriptional regulator